MSRIAAKPITATAPILTFILTSRCSTKWSVSHGRILTLLPAGSLSPTRHGLRERDTAAGLTSDEVALGGHKHMAVALPGRLRRYSRLRRIFKPFCICENLQPDHFAALPRRNGIILDGCRGHDERGRASWFLVMGSCNGKESIWIVTASFYVPVDGHDRRGKLKRISKTRATYLDIRVNVHPIGINSRRHARRNGQVARK